MNYKMTYIMNNDNIDNQSLGSVSNWFSQYDNDKTFDMVTNTEEIIKPNIKPNTLRQRKNYLHVNEQNNNIKNVDDNNSDNFEHTSLCSFYPMLLKKIFCLW